MFPHDGQVKNTMGVGECRRFIQFVATLADRELIQSVVLGTHPTWIVYDRDSSKLLTNALDSLKPEDQLVKQLFASNCLPVIKRSTGITPYVPPNAREIAIQNLNSAISQIHESMSGKGLECEWELVLKSNGKEVKLTGPIK